jgi:YHS domain-containing protein
MKTIMTLAASAFLASCAGTVTTATTAGDVKPYTRNTCIVSDNKLGSMGTPIAKVYGDQEVKFCCKPCIAKFEKDPQKYLAKLP